MIDRGDGKADERRADGERRTDRRRPEDPAEPEWVLERIQQTFETRHG